MTTNKEQYTLFPLPPSYLARRRKAFAAAIEVLVELIDLIDGDPDLEPEEDAEHDGREWSGDEADAAWIEWHTLSGDRQGGATMSGGHEDDEDDDPGGGDVNDEPHDPEEGL